jgi:trimethylamine--corrinoid protein Co-methyltransferase
MSQQPQSPGLQFQVLSPPDRQRIYQAALECLERTGLKVLNGQARRLLGQAGAHLQDERVRIPARLVEQAVAAAPSAFTIWGREPGLPGVARRQIDLLPGKVYFGPGPSSSYFIDPQSGERRRSRRADVALAARVCDALENFDYLMGLALPEDVEPERAPVFEFAEMVIHSAKPLLAWAYSLENIRQIDQIACAVCGGEDELRARPIYGLFALGQGPLVAPDTVIENALWCAGHGIPVIYHGPGVAGVSAPVTGAGALVVCLAGCLGGLAILQLHQPGAPVCLGSVPSAMDPRSGRPAYGGPETSLYSAALAEIFRDLKLPFMGTAGASEAKTLDLQAAIESSVQVIFSLLSRTTLPHDAGFLDCADLASLEMLVMNDEIISLARRLARGIEVSDETLMLDAIDQAGPGGEFISSLETARRMRQEIWLPRLMDRQPWAQWQNRGALGMQERIQARLRQILDHHMPPPLPGEVLESIGAILEQRA